MNRRKFSQSVMSALGVTLIPTSVVVASKLETHSIGKPIVSDATIKTEEGLKLKLLKHEYGTENRDEKQFILTYKVANPSTKLEEKIYHLKVGDGQVQPVHMSPVSENQLQAVFNWRLNG